MTQLAKATWISIGCIIASIVFVFIVTGGLSFSAILGSFLAVKVIFIVAAIAFIVQGFRVHWGWGLANMFLAPLSCIVFFVMHRREGKVPMYVAGYGLTLLLVFLVVAMI